MRQRGAVFVVTLAILAVLVAIVASVAQTERIALKQQIYQQDETHARRAAEAGIQRGIEVLCDEGASGVTTTNVSAGGVQGTNANQPGATTLQDDWATLGTSGNDLFQLKSTTFRLQIIDAASLVNLNTASSTQLQNLPLTQQQIDSVLDWRSTGETASSDGAKDAYYNGLQNPYDTALQGLSTVNELLDIQAFTPTDLYDPATVTPLGGTPIPDLADGQTPSLADLVTVDSSSANVNAQGTALTALSRISQNTLARYGFNRTSARALYNARNDTTWAQIIRADPAMSTGQFRNLLNNYYVGSSTQSGKINVNTASQATLQTIPGISQDEATSIVNQQSTGYTSMGSILTIPGLTSVRSASGVIDQLTVNSSVFIIRVIGAAGQVSVPLQAIVKITPATTAGNAATATIVRVEEAPFHDMTGRWGWQSQTTNVVPLEAGS